MRFPDNPRCSRCDRCRHEFHCGEPAEPDGIDLPAPANLETIALVSPLLPEPDAVHLPVVVANYAALKNCSDQRANDGTYCEKNRQQHENGYCISDVHDAIASGDRAATFAASISSAVAPASGMTRGQ